MARKILLADDSVTAQNMGRKILTDAGYDVVTVNNGSAALKRVGEQKPDLIVLDVYMPGYSGLEVCARLKDSPETSRIPILLTVGKLEPFKPEEASRVRADAFIVKPFEASELLTALTRLEDRMVPQADGGRFATSVSGIERFTAESGKQAEPADEDGGWKSRLRFPSKKKKEEPDPEPEEDFTVVNSRKGVIRPPAPSGTFAVSSTPQTQEPGLVPDIPRDITPEELDALSELVAKLDGPIPASEAAAPLSEKIGPVEVGPISSGEVKKEELKKEETKAEEIKPEPVASALAQPDAGSLPAKAVLEAEAAPLIEKAETTASDVPSSALATFSVEPPPTEEVSREPQAAVASEEPAAVAKVEESSSAVVEPPRPAASEKRKEAATAEGVATSTASVAEAASPTEIGAATVAEKAKAEDVPRPEPVPESVVASSVSTSEAQAGTHVKAPSPEDLAEALRLLTPQTGQALADAGAALAAELSRGPVATRWVAEAVVLSPEEASASLEAEMFKSFAEGNTAAVPSETSAEAATSAPVHHEEEEAAEVAVEAAEEAGEAATITERATVSVAESPGAVLPSDPDPQPEKPGEISAVKESRQQEESSNEEVAAMTFADAVQSETEAIPVSAAAEVSSAGEPGGSDEMAKDAKGKGKSNWHQIHSTDATKADVVEAAKQSEEPPKAMAAAAADGSSDPSAIANIVDSVLADLRPKIVEEIAKKLSKK